MALGIVQFFKNILEFKIIIYYFFIFYILVSLLESGILQAGIGCSHVNTLLASLDVPEFW